MNDDLRRIDMHAHYYGGGLVEFLKARNERPCLRIDDHGNTVMMAMNGQFPFTADYHDDAVVLSNMRAQNLTHRLITFPGALGVDVLPVHGIAEVISNYNNHLAQLMQDSQGMLVGLAGLPLVDLELACNEARRIRCDLNLPGFILPANYLNSIAEANTLRPLFEAINDLCCHIMVHPGLTVGQEPPVRPTDMIQYRVSAIELQSSISQTTLTLVLSDLLDLYPNLSFQVVNLGGTLPFIVERIESIARHRNPTKPFPRHALKRLWYDCASLGPRALEAAVTLYGADRIMLGSDYPIFKEDPYSSAVVPAKLTPEQKRLITFQNATMLLKKLDRDPTMSDQER
ncbi:MAG: amidohydrolase family protein [Aestuariivita sp.]|nr:amidohydrolase family protein [Aestuariivita sp.]